MSVKKNKIININVSNFRPWNCDTCNNTKQFCSFYASRYLTQSPPVQTVTRPPLEAGLEEPNFDPTEVVLDFFNSDLNLKIDPDG